MTTTPSHAKPPVNLKRPPRNAPARLHNRICVAPHRILSTRAVRVSAFDLRLHKTLALMGEALLRSEGVGIAAPQVGFAIRAAIISYDAVAYTLVNPEIVWRSDETVTQDEACLSLPRRYYQAVERAASVRVRYQDMHGKRYVQTFTGMLARIVQHEVDHLDGILVAERVTRQQIMPLRGRVPAMTNMPPSMEVTNPE